jgi:hypothetical protein
VLALDTLIGAPLLPGVMCTTGPPSVPTFTDADFLPGTGIPSPGSFDKWMQALRAGVWSFYCECIPATGGAPAPTPFPAPPPLSLPTATGGSPVTLTCDNGDICASLNQIMRAIAAMNAQIAYARRDITLIQRQHVPFAYVLGISHLALSGEGTIAIQGILGVTVQATSLPGYLGSDMDSIAASNYYLGSLNLGTTDGWTRKIKLTHNPHLVLDIDGDMSVLEYHFSDGVVANIQELLREP